MTPPTPSPPDAQILDIYKLAVEMSDRVSARRLNANAFFVTVQGAIVAALGFLTSKAAPSTLPLVALCAVGVLSAGIWFLLLLRYRDLNTAKFVVIHKIEEDLPLKVFTDEWEHLKGSANNPTRKRYSELGDVERLAPLVFALINLCLGVYVVTA